MRRRVALGAPARVAAQVAVLLLLPACQVDFEPEAGGNAAVDAAGGDDSGDAGDSGDDAGCTPKPETCNGADDDCDGATDEELGEQSCGDGACAVTLPVCVAGRLAECRPRDPIPEVCNGEDDDCDGDIDEADGGGPLERECFSGPPESEGVGTCRAGLRTCEGGAYPEGPCPGEVPPAPEVEDDGQDNDCDGLLDEGFAALYFEGRYDSWVRVDAAEDLGRDLELRDTAFTIDAWVRPRILTPYRFNTIISRRSEASGDGWLLGITGKAVFDSLNNAVPVFLVGDWPDDEAEASGRVAGGRSAVATVAEDRWAHVAVTYEPGAGAGGKHRVRLFLDGVLVRRDDGFEADMPAPVRDLDTLVGADARSVPDAFDGWIGDVRITARVRYPDAPGCRASGDACFEPEPCPEADGDALAHWPLSEGAGDAISDVSGHGRAGRVSGDVDGPDSRWHADVACGDRASGG